MKQKIFVTLGTTVLMLGLAMNVQYALADYGIEKNSLPIAVLSQSGTSGGGDGTVSSDHGHQESRNIECTIKISDGQGSSYEQKITGKSMWCKGDNYVERCSNFNPCSGFYEQ